MPDNPKDNVAVMGKWMMYLTWILGLALASYFFQNWIDHKRNPNQSLSSNSQQPVVLRQNSQGHYVASGMINDTPVVFLLDTGATSVVVGEELAAQLSLQRNGQTQVSTANGVINVSATQLKSVNLGGLTATNIAAYINPYADSSTVLLGMSFLKHLTLVQKNNTLTLSVP
ncbi:MAG: retropepsin-like aspartic protease [Oceanospirillaceae bacterium]